MFVTIFKVVAQLLLACKIVSTLRSHYQVMTWIRFHPLVLALYSILQMLKNFQMKKKCKELSNEQEISNCQEENDIDADNSECNLLQPSTRLRKVEEMLNKRKGKKLTTKFIQEAQALHLSEKIFS